MFIMTVEERMDHLECKDDHRFASKAAGTAGVTLGTIGTAIGALGMLNGNGNWGGLLGNNRSDGDQPVNRYEMQNQMNCAKQIQDKDLEIAALTTEIKLRDANTYTDSKFLQLYQYVDTKFEELKSNLGAQAVLNQANKDSFQLMQERLDCAKHECCAAIANEAKERRCADNTIVTYANATFYPKQVADVTVGTTTTAQTLYNPLPSCGCNTGCGNNVFTF
jgi:hypothetical protein